MTKYFNILSIHPELTIFLTLAVGFMIGYIRIGNFRVWAVLGYTIPYALGNILLTAWGPIIVALMTRL